MILSWRETDQAARPTPPAGEFLAAAPRVMAATSVGIPALTEEAGEGPDGLGIGLECRRRDVRRPEVTGTGRRAGGQIAGCDKIGSAGGWLHNQ